MNRGPENVFGKAPGRFDEVMARRLARTLPEQALSACAAMDEEQFARFVELFNAVFGQGGGRPYRLARYAPPSSLAASPPRE